MVVLDGVSQHYNIWKNYENKTKQNKTKQNKTKQNKTAASNNITNLA